MKYQNLKRVVAVLFAAALAVCSFAVAASAQDTATSTSIMYTLAGGSSDEKGGGDYVIDIDAVGGLINIGAITVKYDTGLYSGIIFDPAENITDASYFWGVDNSADGEFTFAFSSDNADDDIANLFAEDNASGTVAYIDATNPVNIGTLTLTFDGENTYESSFTTKAGDDSSIEIVAAEYILHDGDSYEVTKEDAEYEITNTLVFSADDFTVSDSEVTYEKEKFWSPTVTSTVADTFQVSLIPDYTSDESVTNAGTYPIVVIKASGEGYYYADKIDLGVNFVINKAEVEIEAPAELESVDYVAPNGYNLEDLEIEGWDVVTTGYLNAGTHSIDIMYAGEFDTANNIYFFNDEEVASKEDIVATVSLNVAKIKGNVPSIDAPDAVTYNADVAQTVNGYEIELFKGWEFVDANTALVIGENKDIAIKYIPEDLDNYTYEGYDETLGYVPGKVTVTLNKATATINKPANLAAVDYVAGGVNASELTLPENWIYADAADKKLEAGADQTIAVKYNGTLDTTNYNYVAGENVTGDVENGFTSTVTVTVNKIAGTLPALTTAYEATFDSNKADKKVGDYVSVVEDDWTLVNPDAVLEYKDDNKFAVETAVDTKNYTYEAEGVTVGDGKVTAEITVKFNKAQGTVPALTKTYEATYDAEKADKKVATYITIADAAWKLADADAVLEYKADNKFTVEYVTNTVDYEYPATEGITVGDGKLTAEITVDFKKAVGTVNAPTAPESVTYDKSKNESKKVTAYIESFGEGWTVADENAMLSYGDNTITVKHTADTVNYTWEDYTVADGYITTTVSVKFNKATLPEDAASAANVVVTFDGTAKTVEVKANDTVYSGLGEFTVAYPEGNINAGTYDVTVTFAEGDNYLGGTITFADVLVIEKAVLPEMSVPEISSEMLVGDVLTGAADDNNWNYSQTYTIVEGENKIVVAKIIGAQTAMNWDFTKAAEDKGATAIENADKSVTLTKEYTVIGKKPTGTISFEAIAIQGVTVDDSDVTVTITPDQGEAFVLEHDSEGHIIFADDYELNTGKYTISIKKARYLETVISFDLSVSEKLDLGQITLIPGDIVGGPQGSETDGDGVIDIDDFVIGVRAFDSEVLDIVKSAADIDKNGANNVTDLGFIKANFGKSTAKDCTIIVK